MSQPSKTLAWISYGLQGFLSLAFAAGAISNILKFESAVKAAEDMGFPDGSVVILGIILLVAVILYAVPQTSVVGAGFITAWLGGAVATHMIHSDTFGMTIMPVIFGILIWLAIWLRNMDLRKVFPLQS